MTDTVIRDVRNDPLQQRISRRDVMCWWVCAVTVLTPTGVTTRHSTQSGEMGEQLAGRQAIGDEELTDVLDVSVVPMFGFVPEVQS